MRRNGAQTRRARREKVKENEYLGKKSKKREEEWEEQDETEPRRHIERGEFENFITHE